MTRTSAQLFHQYVGKKAMVTVLDAPHTTRKSRTQNGKVHDVQAKLGVRIPCIIVDTKVVWSHELALIRPEYGEGSEWVKITGKVTVVERWPHECTSKAPANDIPPDVGDH